MLGLGFSPSECRRKEDFGVSQRFSGRLSRKTLLPGYDDGDVEIRLPRKPEASGFVNHSMVRKLPSCFFKASLSDH